MSATDQGEALPQRYSVDDIVEQYPLLTNVELAVAAGTSLSTARRMRRGAGVAPKPDPFVSKPISTPSEVQQYPPDCLKDPTWLREQYVAKRYGTPLIGRMTGRSPSTVGYYLRGHNIPIRPGRISRNPCSTATWLTAHYIDQRLSIAACARLAGTCRETIRSWLVRHGIKVRDRREAARATDSLVTYP